MKTTLAMALMGAALISVPAIAQQPATPNQNATQQEAGTKAAPLYQMKAGQWRASKLDGLDVYNNNNEKIGDISELVLDRNGKVDAVVIGVGGFLGVGEHQVAVPFDKVQWVDQPVQVSGTSRTTTGSSTTASGTSTAPAERTTTTTTDSGNGTTSSTTTTANNRTDATQYHPDHAVVAMTKDQLKALPEVRYAK